MKSININSLQRIIEIFGSKTKQWKCYLPIINLVLFIGVVGLAGVCVMRVYSPPEHIKKTARHAEEFPAKKHQMPPLSANVKSLDYYELMVSNNPFSPTRNSWISQGAKADSKTESKHEETIIQPVVEQPKPKGPPKKINLRGILILGNTRKALIENPDPAKYKKPFIFIEEGEDVVEYKVKNIESDQIRLDWYGEEQIIVMRSNIKK